MGRREVITAPIAKLFWSRGSQAVRPPRAFRMEGTEVRIRREGQKVILEPLADDWAWLDAIAGTFSDDFFAEGHQQPAGQERPALDRLFD